MGKERYETTMRSTPKKLKSEKATEIPRRASCCCPLKPYRGGVGTRVGYEGHFAMKKMI